MATLTPFQQKLLADQAAYTGPKASYLGAAPTPAAPATSAATDAQRQYLDWQANQEFAGQKISDIWDMQGISDPYTNQLLLSSAQKELDNASNRTALYGSAGLATPTGVAPWGSTAATTPNPAAPTPNPVVTPVTPPVPQSQAHRNSYGNGANQVAGYQQPNQATAYTEADWNIWDTPTGYTGQQANSTAFQGGGTGASVGGVSGQTPPAWWMAGSNSAAAKRRSPGAGYINPYSGSGSGVDGYQEPWF